MSIGDAEIKTQERVIRFFKDPEILGYQYIGNLSDYQNKNIKEDRLRQYLRLKGYADKLIDAAIMQLLLSLIKASKKYAGTISILASSVPSRGLLI